MIRSILLSFFTFLLVFSVPSLSQAKDDVKVGDTIPSDLSAKDQTGKMRSFGNLKGSKGMTLVFIRSVEWCPFCQKQLLDLNKNAKKFSDAGYPVVTVSYDALPQIEKFVTKNKPTITLLSDPASEIIRAFGILNEASAKGTMSYGIPHPGVYIVSKDKKVQAKFFKKGYKDRPSTDELLAEIKKLNPPPAPVYESLDNMGEDPILPEDAMIETPEKILDPIVIPDDFDADSSEILEETMSDEVIPESLQKPNVIDKAMPETVVPDALSDVEVKETEGFSLPEGTEMREEALPPAM